jgi:hypothetical protein
MAKEKIIGYLALLIICQSNRVKVLNDLLWRFIFLNLAVKVEANHVACCQLRCQFEELHEALLLSLLHALGRHTDDEMDISIVMVFFVVLKPL